MYCRITQSILLALFCTLQLSLQLIINVASSTTVCFTFQDEKAKKKYPKYHNKSKKKRNRKIGRIIDIFLDPVTYLTQLTQMRKDPAPCYRLLQELGSKTEKKFEIQVLPF